MRVGDELVAVAVAGDDDDVVAARRRARSTAAAIRSSASHPGELDLLDPERVEHLAHEAHLLAQDVGRRVAVGLVLGVGVVAERGLGAVEGDEHAVGLRGPSAR